MSVQTVLGFDFGLKRIGMAVGQTITHTASPLAILPASDGEPDWHACDAQVKSWKPQALVVGLPFPERVTDTSMLQAVRVFVKALKARYDIPVYGVDERFTSKEARQRINEMEHVKRSKKKRVDSQAACLIVESWLKEPAASEAL